MFSWSILVKDIKYMPFLLMHTVHFSDILELEVTV
jgi:hypothetical protein